MFCNNSICQNTQDVVISDSMKEQSSIARRIPHFTLRTILGVSTRISNI